MKAYNKERRIIVRESNWAWYQDLKRKPCADCKGVFDPLAMDFDHVGAKKAAPSNLMAKAATRERILREIEVCELICANCHRIRTYARSPRWTYRVTELAATIVQLKDAPCLDCGNRFPAEAMDFDHRDPKTKKYAIARMKSRSLRFLPQLMEEVAKCDLVCHCCHRLRTARTFRWQSSSHPHN